MIRVGVIGLGFMGGVHLRNWQALDGVCVVAVCDRDRAATAGKQGNLDLETGEVDLEGVAFYGEVSDMLADEALDAVSIALPTHLHRDISVQCLNAGVHVLCEKPMALTVEACDAMIEAANASGKQLMVAHCIRFWPEYAWLKGVVESGKYGKVLAAEFSRLTSAPAWEGDSWFADVTRSGGVVLDLHIHDLDFVQYLLGEPKGLRSQCARFENGLPGHVQTWFDYGDNRAISATGSWMMPESFGFEMAFSVVLEKAAVRFDGEVLNVCPSEGEPFVVELEGDGYRGEIEHFARRVAGKEAKAVITPEQARESVRMALETAGA